MEGEGKWLIVKVWVRSVDGSRRVGSSIDSTLRRRGSSNIASRGSANERRGKGKRGSEYRGGKHLTKGEVERRTRAQNKSSRIYTPEKKPIRCQRSWESKVCVIAGRHRWVLKQYHVRIMTVLQVCYMTSFLAKSCWACIGPTWRCLRPQRGGSSQEDSKSYIIWLVDTTANLVFQLSDLAAAFNYLLRGARLEPGISGIMIRLLIRIIKK